MAEKTNKENKGLNALIPRKDSADYILSGEEMRTLVKTLDELLGKLPDKVVDEFSKSKEFELYRKLVKKYG